MSQQFEAPAGIGAPVSDAGIELGRAWEWRFPLVMSLVMLALLVIGGALGLAFIPNGPWHHGGGVFNQLLSWDGQWYADIAHKGYSWNPAVGELPAHYQSTDFYPLYPLIDHIIMVLTGNTQPVVIVVLGEVLGIGSIFTFHRLARRLLPPDAAMRATALYAIWPAAIYFAMGYPTGLINLCVIAALAAYVERQFWRAAFWCGLGTAAAPTVVFIAVALCLDQGIAWLRGGRAMREVPRLIGFGLLTVGGLIGYMIFQFIEFHDPFTFIKAQEAWGVSPPFLVRLGRFLDPAWYLYLPALAWQYALHVHHVMLATGRPFASFMPHVAWHEQGLLCFFIFLLGIAGIITALRRIRPLVLPGAGLAVFLGYTWFISTTGQNLDATPRLLYPALALFLGLGLLFTPKRRWLFYPVLAMLIVFTLLNNAFALTGYWLV
jgi:hypothetical protein